MAEIYVYDKNAVDFDNMGLVGALTPTKCLFEEEANGMSEISIEHPFDASGKWAAFENERIISAPVPVRTCPEIEGGRIVTSVETWTVRDTATKAQRGAYTKKSGGRRKGTFKKGAQVTVVSKPADADRYKVKTGKLGGWVSIEALDYDETKVISPDPNSIDEVASAWKVRDQYFRIYKITMTLTGVTVQARHIIYDLLGNITNYEDNGSVSAADALQNVIDNCAVPVDEIEVFTDSDNTRAGLHYELVNPIFAMLDEAEGIAPRYDLELVRDNFVMYFLSRAGMNRGVSIEYGKNLTGLTAEEDFDGIITRVIPKGTKKKGETLLLTDGNGVEVPWVESENASDFAIPHIEVLECDDCEVGQNGVTKELALARMREQAQELFDFGDEDIPGVNVKSLKLTVDFISLSKVAGYEEYAALEKCFLFDTVTILDKSKGFVALARITRGVWDVLLGQWDEMELETANYTARGSWESYFASAIRKLESESRKEYTLEIDWSNGTVIDSDNVATTATARLLKHGSDVTDEYTDEDFSWTMVTAGARTPERIAADNEWTAAHANMRSVTLDIDDVSTSAVISCKVVVIVQGRSITFRHSATIVFKRDGKDGTMIEYIFKLTEDDTAPTIDEDEEARKEDEYRPNLPGDIPPIWTDDPAGVSEVYPYEWVSFRRKKDGLWGTFSAPALWAHYASDGADGADGSNGLPGADGTRVYYMSYSPGYYTPGNDGDLWYVMSGIDVQSVYKYSDGWSQFKFDSDTLSARCITAGHIATGAITAGIINAADLAIMNTDGTFNARIRAGAHTFTSTASSAPTSSEGGTDVGDTQTDNAITKSITISSENVDKGLSLNSVSGNTETLEGAFCIAEVNNVPALCVLSSGKPLYIGGPVANIFFGNHPTTAADKGIIMTGHVLPNTGGAFRLGGNGGGRRWKRLFASIAVNVSSDERLKKDIAPSKALYLLKQLNPKRYRFIEDDKKLHFGFVAQDVAEIIRGTELADIDFYDDENPDSLGLVYDELIAPLVEGWQAHERRIGELEGQLRALEERLNALENDGR